MTGIFWPLRDARLTLLLKRSQRGDSSAFRALYRTLHGPVARYVHRRIRAADDAEDVVAQVFLKLVEALPRMDARKGSVLGYMLAAARTEVVDLLRRGATRGSLDGLEGTLEDPAPGALATLARVEEREALRRALGALSEEDRELLSLRFGEDLRFSEIAQLLKLSEVAARKRVSRALQTLRASPELETKGALANDG